jgi:probable phosphoglycerate mutase
MLSELERTINGRRRLYLLRHGDVSYFDAAGQPFRQDEVPLNELGVAQAEEAARVLAGVELDRVVVSGLRRTVETAAFLVAARGFDAAVCADLREVAAGRLRDLPRDGIERAFVEALGRHVERSTRFLGGETFGSLWERVLGALAGILADRSWRQLAIVAHGGTNRAIICHALGAGFAALGSIEQDAGCINIIDVDPDGSLLVRLLNYSPLDPVKQEHRLKTMEKIFLENLAPLAARRAESGPEGAG